MNLQMYRNKLEQKKGKKEQLELLIKEVTDNIKWGQRQLKNHEDALFIVQTVAQQTQKELEFHISDIVSLALEAVFDDPYEFHVEFVIKRGKTEAELCFLKNGQKIDPMDSSGGGVVDVASLALRIALWNLQTPKSMNTLILDEPMKFVSADLRPRVVDMIKQLSKKLNIQIIMVTHMDEMTEGANKVFNVSIHNNISNITTT